MIGFKRSVRSSHASYHFVFTKARARTCTETSRRARCRRRARARCRRRASIVDRHKKRLFGPEHGDECSVDHRASHIICACHRSCNKKKKPTLCQTGKSLRIFPGLLRGAGYFCRNSGENTKTPVAIILSLHWNKDSQSQKNRHMCSSSHTLIQI